MWDTILTFNQNCLIPSQGKQLYPTLVLLEQSNCIDWINLYTVTDQYTAFLLQMYLIHVERRLRNGTSISTDVIENTPENNENNNNVSAICIGFFFTLQDPLSVKQIICSYYFPTMHI